MWLNQSGPTVFDQLTIFKEWLFKTYNYIILSNNILQLKTRKVIDEMYWIIHNEIDSWCYHRRIHSLINVNIISKFHTEQIKLIAVHVWRLTYCLVSSLQTWFNTSFSRFRCSNKFQITIFFLYQSIYHSPFFSFVCDYFIQITRLLRQNRFYVQ